MRAYLLAPLGLALLAAACGESTGERATTGAAGGAVTGAAVGGPVGAVVGGGIGAAGGAYRPEVDQKTDEVAQNATGRNDSSGATGTQNRSTRGAATSTSRASQGDVRQAQTALQKMGYYNGKIDGLYGRQTAAAVRSYQAKANLTQTGRLDRTTMQHLRNDVAASGTNSSTPRSSSSGTSGNSGSVAPNAPGSSGTSGNSGSIAPDPASSSGTNSTNPGDSQMNR